VTTLLAAARPSLSKMMEWHVRQNATGLITAGVLVLLLIGITPLLPPEHRKRARNAIIVGLLYGLAILVPAWAGTYNFQISDSYFLLRDFLLGWTIVAFVGLVVFDFFLRRWGVVAPKIVRDLVGAGLFFVTALMILRGHGVNPLSLITTSVVFTAVIGFALQDTIGNFFAGLALQMERTLSVGDWIEADGNVGRITAIRLRSTTIVTKDGDLIALPNGIFLKGKVKNFSKPSGLHRLWVKVGVGYAHQPNEVRAALLRATREAPGVETEPAPDALVFEFGDSAITYAVRFWISDFARDDGILSGVRSRMYYHLRRAEMEISYPQRNVNLQLVNEETRKQTRAADINRRRSILAGVDLFREVPQQTRDDLAERMKKLTFADGEVIIRQGDPGDSLYVIRNGEVVVQVEVGGQTREVAVLRDGAFFGEMSLMTGEARKATCMARGDATVYLLDKAGFQEILQQNEQIIEGISTKLTQRQLALEAQREGAAAVSQQKVEQQSGQLLARIKNFFRLKA